MIYAMHGIVQDRKPNLFGHRIFLDYDTFESYLSSRTRFVDLQAALAGKGDALTIDDATSAAADAARLAISKGHQVTLFVNGFNVKNEYPYCFAQVNRLLDQTQVRSVMFRGAKYAVTTFEEKRVFRKHLKRTYRYLKSYKEESTFIDELARSLAVAQSTFLSNDPLTLSQVSLEELCNLGVDLGNHGWHHVDPKYLQPDAFHHHFFDNYKWLKNAFEVDSRVYAVPYGETVPPYIDQQAIEACLLLTDNPPQLPCNVLLTNRIHLQLS